MGGIYLMISHCSEIWDFPGNMTGYYSIKMRASLVLTHDDPDVESVLVHISGAERIIQKQEIDAMSTALIHRAQNLDKENCKESSSYYTSKRHRSDNQRRSRPFFTFRSFLNNTAINWTSSTSLFFEFKKIRNS
jgi:hypothetical protein